MAVKKSAVTMIIRRLSFILPDGVTENHVNNLYRPATQIKIGTVIKVSPPKKTMSEQECFSAEF